jgi:hypothetical protein
MLRIEWSLYMENPSKPLTPLQTQMRLNTQRKLAAKPRQGMVSQDRFPSGELPFVKGQAKPKD